MFPTGSSFVRCSSQVGLGPARRAASAALYDGQRERRRSQPLVADRVRRRASARTSPSGTARNRLPLRFPQLQMEQICQDVSGDAEMRMSPTRGSAIVRGE